MSGAGGADAGFGGERRKAKFGIDFKWIKGFMQVYEHWTNPFNREQKGGRRSPTGVI
jgi:hypothetical protein